MVRAGRDDMSDTSSDSGSDSVVDDDAQAIEDKKVDPADEVDILLDLRPGETTQDLFSGPSSICRHPAAD